MAAPATLADLRLAGRRHFPFLGDAFAALVPVERRVHAPGDDRPTLAVDRFWRLYWSPEALERFDSAAESAAALAHEVSHLLRHHHDRLPIVPEPIRSISLECEINDDLPGLPGWVIRPSQHRLPEGQTAEWYAAQLMARGENQPDQSGAGKSGADGEPGESGESGADQSGQSASQSGTDQPGQSGQPGRSGADQSGADGQSSADGESSADGADQSGAGESGAGQSGESGASGQSGNAGQPGAGQPGADGASGADQSGQPGQSGTACASSRGSACGQQAAPWEDPAPGTPGAADGLSEPEIRRVRERVARAIATHVAQHGRGSVPGDLVVWADATLDATEAARRAPTWRRVLAAHVRAGIARRGADDDSARVRAGATMSRGIIATRRVRRVPDVCVVVDTSGSMGADGRDVGATVEAICRTVGRVGVVYADAAVAGTATVSGGRDALRHAVGGGGTDLRAAIRDAARRADVVVVVTDCDTPWDDRPPRGGRVIVARTRRDGDVPGWVRHVIDVGGAR